MQILISSSTYSKTRISNRNLTSRIVHLMKTMTKKKIMQKQKPPKEMEIEKEKVKLLRSDHKLEIKHRSL